MKKFGKIYVGCVALCVFTIMGVFYVPVVAKGKIKIGIIRQIDIKPLLDAQAGTIKALADMGYGKDKVTYIEVAVNNKIDTIKDSVAKLRKKKVDVIVTIATLATIETLKHVKDIPVVYNTVSYPESIIDNGKKFGYGTNYTGATLKVPINPLIKLTQKIEKPKTIGMVFNIHEENARRDVEEVEKAARAFNLTSITLPYSDTSKEGIIRTFQKLVNLNVDCVILPKDTLQVKYSDEIAPILHKKRLLVLAMDASFVQKGVALLAFTAPCYKVGYLSGKKIAGILKGKDPNSMPVEGLEKFDIFLNTKVAKKTKKKIPIGILKMASEVIK